MTDRTPEQHAEIAAVAMTMRHFGHDGIPGAPADSSICPRCNAERSLAALARLAADTERLREALRDIHRNAQSNHQWWSQERAGAALASPPADTEQRDPDLCPECGESLSRSYGPDWCVTHLNKPADTEQP